MTQTHAAFPAYVPPDHSGLSAAFPRIEAIFHEFAEKQKVPGLSYGLVVDGNLVISGGIGIQNTTDRSPVTPDSVFRIASMTKSFTAMALVKLRDEGKLRLDAPAAEYVPELAALHYPTRDSAPVTVRQIMTMSAGWPQDDPWADRQLASEESQLSEWLSSGISFSNPPGVKFEYSNLGYAVLGRIVANVSGVNYSTYVTENILKPLGMTSSTFDVRTIPPERLALGHRREGDQWVPEIPLKDGAFASIGGLFTTITDFARYMAYLLDAFPARDDDEDIIVIRRSSRREMQQGGRQRFLTSSRTAPDVPAVVLSDAYGYGLLQAFDSQLGYSISHGGGLPGYGTYYRLLPDCGIGVVAFTNLTYTAAVPSITSVLVELGKVGGLKPRTIAPAPVLLDMQKAVTDLYNQWSDEGIQAISTQSFFQDTPLEKRRQQVTELRAKLGKCVSVTPFEPENALRGRWTLKCSGGSIDAWITLAPMVPPKLQVLQFTAAKRISPALKSAAAGLVGLIGEWNEETASGLLARSVKRPVLRAQLEAVRVLYGAVKLGDTLESDGATFARVRLNGRLGITDMKLVLNTNTGKVTEVTFTRPRETMFVP